MKQEIKLKKLVGSRTRSKLIKILFDKPSNSFFVRQLVRQTNEEINSVRRELASMYQINMVLMDKKSNKVFYRPNPNFPFYEELVLISCKCQQFWKDIRKCILANSGEYRIICTKEFLWSQTETNEQQIDMIVVGKIWVDKLTRIINNQEKIIGREINYMVMSKKEFKLRVNKRDPFMVDFFLKSPITIMGKHV